MYLRTGITSLATLGTLATLASEASGQSSLREPESRGKMRWNVDVAAQYAQPVGEFRTNVREAWGATIAARHRFAWFDALGLRADFGFLNYGNERQRVPLSPTVNRVVVDMTTSNNVALASAGPFLAVPRGPLRPYVFGFAGYSYFYTQSSVGDDNESSSFASTTHLGDGGLAYGWGGGISVPIHFRKLSIALDIGGRHTTNGVRTYLRRGDILDLPDGSLQLTRRTTDANFRQFHVGASFGLQR